MYVYTGSELSVHTHAHVSNFIPLCCLIFDCEVGIRAHVCLSTHYQYNAILAVGSHE